MLNVKFLLKEEKTKMINKINTKYLINTNKNKNGTKNIESRYLKCKKPRCFDNLLYETNVLVISIQVFHSPMHFILYFFPMKTNKAKHVEKYTLNINFICT